MRRLEFLDPADPFERALLDYCVEKLEVRGCLSTSATVEDRFLRYASVRVFEHIMEGNFLYAIISRCMMLEHAGREALLNLWELFAFTVEKERGAGLAKGLFATVVNIVDWDYASRIEVLEANVGPEEATKLAAWVVKLREVSVTRSATLQWLVLNFLFDVVDPLLYFFRE